jgi:N-[(2S)-2-amino-2-carboxyethyl]-L-glutamate dehydrogenase
MLILRRKDVLDLLDGAEEALIRTVSRTYVAHAAKDTSVPHAAFLRFPDEACNRIIALPAYVGGERPVASVKWIASFPGNIDQGLERASATIVVNSTRTGRPLAMVEGSVISARRTAASAALAADTLTAGAPGGVRDCVTLIGCGVINFEILRFLRSRLPELAAVTLFGHPRRHRPGTGRGFRGPSRGSPRGDRGRRRERAGRAPAGLRRDHGRGPAPVHGVLPAGHGPAPHLPA